MDAREGFSASRATGIELASHCTQNNILGCSEQRFGQIWNNFFFCRWSQWVSINLDRDMCWLGGRFLQHWCRGLRMRVRPGIFAFCDDLIDEENRADFHCLCMTGWSKMCRSESWNWDVRFITTAHNGLWGGMGLFRPVSVGKRLLWDTISPRTMLKVQIYSHTGFTTHTPAPWHHCRSLNHQSSSSEPLSELSLNEEHSYCGLVPSIIGC